MTVEIKTIGVKPVRNTFAHLARRFGDKPASRYQEATYDIQSQTNFHYRPLWDPERELYDRGRTAVVMADWYALKDPRQFYYGTYTTTRAKQQEAMDRQFEFVQKRDLLRLLPDETQARIAFALVPLRHYEWGANTNNCYITAYGWGTAITQATMCNTMDRLGLAQHLSRIGLLIDGNSGDTLRQGKQAWMEDAAWQGLRRQIENMMVTADWFELFVAQNLVADGLVYPLFFEKFDAAIANAHGPSLAMLTEFNARWFDESSRWVDFVIKTAAAESEANKALILGWIRDWQAALSAALAPLAARLLEGPLDPVVEAFAARLGKLGLKG